MLQLLLLIYGIYALVTGRWRLIFGKEVRGPRARWAGVVLILAPIISFVIGVVMGMQIYATSRNPTADIQKFQGTALVLDIVIMICSLIIATLITSTAPPEYIMDTGNKGKRKLNKSNVYNVEDVAGLLHITPAEVLKLIQEKKLTAKWVDGTYEIDRIIFDQYFALHRQNQAMNNPPVFSPTAPAPYSPISEIIDTPSYSGNPTLKPFEDAVLQNPNDPQALFNRGRAYYSAGLTSMAALDFVRVLQLQPNHPNAASMRGFVAQYGNTNRSSSGNFEGVEQIRS